MPFKHPGVAGAMKLKAARLGSWSSFAQHIDEVGRAVGANSSGLRHPHRVCRCPIWDSVLLRLPVWHVIQPGRGISVLVSGLCLAVRIVDDAASDVVAVHSHAPADPPVCRGVPRHSPVVPADDLRHRRREGVARGIGAAALHRAFLPPPHRSRTGGVLPVRRSPGSRRGSRFRRRGAQRLRPRGTGCLGNNGSWATRWPRWWSRRSSSIGALASRGKHGHPTGSGGWKRLL